MVTKKKTKKSKSKRNPKPTKPEPRPGKRAQLKRPKMTKNTTGYTVRERVPLPWGRIRRNEIDYPFDFMQVGASFTFQQGGKGASRVYSASVSYCKQEENFHKKFVVRKIKEETLGKKITFTYGCWRMSDLSKEEIGAKKKQIGIKFH